MSSQRDGPRLTLTVADDGVGFAEGLVAGGSSGLGIGLVQRLVGQVEGEIELER